MILKYALKDLSRNYHKISSIIVTLFISLFILSAIFTIEDSLKKELNDNAKALLGGDLEIDYNRNQGNLDLVNKVKEFFDIDTWQINQPISIADLIYEIGLVEGVQTVTDVEIKNLWDENMGYSGNVYDIDEALRKKVLYPSMDPSIFEIRFPNQDIQGKVQEG